MSVYFVYRTTYNTPLEKYLCRFEDDSVLSWAQRIWQPIPERESAFEHASALLGGLEVYSFGSLFSGIAEENTPAPRSMAALRKAFEQYLYVNEIKHGPHHLQLMTDDDETEMAIYLFDDHYRAAHPGQADWLLHEGWALPPGDRRAKKEPLVYTRAMKPAGDGEGRLYPITLAAFDSGNLSDLERSLPRIDGVRLEGLCRYLLMLPEEEDGMGSGLEEVREGLREVLARPRGKDAGFLKALRDEPAERAHWAAYSDWLIDQDLPPAGLHLLARALSRATPYHGRDNRQAKRDLLHVAPHVAQAAKHEGRWPDEEFLWFTPHDTFQTWIFFDDRWAAAQPALAEGLVRFATRWDVL